MMTTAHRVVVAGHTGLHKARVLEKLCSHIESSRFTGRPYVVKAAYAEAQLPIPDFLGQNRRDQVAAWGDSLRFALQQLKPHKDLSGIYFLCIHLSYYWESEFSTPLLWPIRFGAHGGTTNLVELLRKRFKPNHIITFIDDVQAVQHRVQSSPDGLQIRLRELLGWRSVEMMMADILARQTVGRSHSWEFANECPFEGSFVVSVRQSPEMVARLLLEPDRPRVYASFPISEPRRINDPEKAKAAVLELDSFRGFLSQHFTTFDPLAIDELPLKKYLPSETRVEDEYDMSGVVIGHHEYNTGSRLVTLPASARWHIPPEQTLCHDEYSDIPKLSVEEIKDICRESSVSSAKTELERNVRKRDFRLIDQSDCVVIYRPTMGQERWSRGTEAEYEYARLRHRPVRVVRDKARDFPLGRGLLSQELGAHEVEEDLGNLDEAANQRVLYDRLEQWVRERGAKRSHAYKMRGAEG